jgi:hypothetical protein
MIKRGLPRFVVGAAVVGLIVAGVTALSQAAAANSHPAPSEAQTTDFRTYSSCPANDRQELTNIAAGASSQLVPGAPTQVLLCRYSGLNPTPSAVGHLLVHRLVTRARTVGRLSHEFDSLKPFQPGSYSCPADFGVKIVAIFRYSGGRSDDPVTLDPDGCASVTNGHLTRTAAFPPGPTLIGQLAGLTNMGVLDPLSRAPTRRR